MVTGVKRCDKHWDKQCSNSLRNSKSCFVNICVPTLPPKRQPTVADLTQDELRKMIRDEVTIICDEMKASLNTEVAELKERLGTIDVQLQQALAIKDTVVAVEKALDHTSQRIDDIYRVSFPALSRQVEQAAVGFALQTLDLDVHRRKWALTIQGLTGEEKEDEKVTRSLCVDLAKQHLGVSDAAGSDLACLNRSAGSGIILRFRDLSQRNEWLTGAKGLRNHADRISVSPDLPPVLRPLKTELLNKRKTLPPEQKSRSFIRYLKQWPYIELVCGQNDPIRPLVTKEAIAKEVLGIDPYLDLKETT